MRLVDVARGRRDTVVQLVEGGGHCAIDKLGDVLAATTTWLSTALC